MNTPNANNNSIPVRTITDRPPKKEQPNQKVRLLHCYPSKLSLQPAALPVIT
jgi:hypothetical protein